MNFIISISIKLSKISIKLITISIKLIENAIELIVQHDLAMYEEYLN
jgi:hypothetical protein